VLVPCDSVCAGRLDGGLCARRRCGANDKHTARGRWRADDLCGSAHVTARDSSDADDENRDAAIELASRGRTSRSNRVPPCQSPCETVANAVSAMSPDQRQRKESTRRPVAHDQVWSGTTGSGKSPRRCQTPTRRATKRDVTRWNRANSVRPGRAPLRRMPGRTLR
jgi:hypothetical protein